MNDQIRSTLQLLARRWQLDHPAPTRARGDAARYAEVGRALLADQVAEALAYLEREAPDVVGEILDERATQDRKWGGPTHDDEHSARDWVFFVARHVHRALDGDDFDRRHWRKQMVRVAALAIAAIEWADRRHEAVVSTHRRALDAVPKEKP